MAPALLLLPGVRKPGRRHSFQHGGLVSERHRTRICVGDLTVTWTDGHESVYVPDWLLPHAYEGAARRQRARWRPTRWRSELAQDFPTVEWTDASDGGVGQQRALQLLRDYGIVQIASIGTDSTATERPATVVIPIYETTVFGYIYDVEAESTAKLGATTGMPQAPHIDDDSYSSPGIDVFHCLMNTEEGGMSTYVDGFAIAASLAAEHPTNTNYSQRCRSLRSVATPARSICETGNH